MVFEYLLQFPSLFWLGHEYMHAWADCTSHQHIQHLHRNLPKFKASIQSGRTFLYVLLVKSHYPDASTYLSIDELT